MSISDDDGYLKLTVTKGGQEHSATADVYVLNEQLAAIAIPTNDAEEQVFWAKMDQWAVAVGLPAGLTRRTLGLLRKVVFDRTADLAKKDRPTASSETPV